MSAKGVGRPIYGNGAPTTDNDVFRAREERPEGHLAEELASLDIPGLRVVSSPGERMMYSRDQSEIPRFLKTFLFKSLPDVVVQPTTSLAVAAVAKFAASKGVAVIARGSGSSPFGGSVPVAGGLVVDMSRMDAILELDPDRRLVRVQAGVRWADLEHELGRHGLHTRSSPSSKFSTVGGWVASGGLGLCSYSAGHMSWSVTSVELATSDGSLRVLEPASDGFTLVFGSEGQLGIVTSITLEVDPVSGSARPHLILFDTVEAALSFAKDVSWGPIRPVHMVYESASKLAMMNQMLSNFGLESGEVVLVYLDGAESETAFAKFISTSGLKEEAEYLARYLWGERHFPMKIRRLGPGMLGTEVLIPQKRLPEAVAKTQGLCASLGIDPSFEVHYLPEGGALLLCFFLVNQGNTFGYTVDAFKSLLLTRLLMDHGGAPYSVGVWNQPFTDAEDRAHMKALRRLKSELDPAHVMNAGKMFHLSGRFGKLGGLMLHPRLMRPLLRMIIAFSPLSTMLIERFSEIVRVRYRPKRRTPLLRTADECAMCGACVSVCPAYLIVGDERVTGRGKMLTVKALAAGQRISEEHARLTSLCMRCKACEQVCQSKLSLVDAYEALEAELEEFHSRDPREVERFIRYAETSPEYDRMVQRGLVLGAPDQGPGGEG